MMLWLLIILITVLVGVFAALVHFKIPLPQKEELTKTISIVGVFATAFSLIWAAYTYHENVKFQNQNYVKNIYKEVENRNLDGNNKEFVEEDKFPSKDPNNIPDNEKAGYRRYQWFVGSGLADYESILEIYSGDTEWQKTVVGFINSHRKYIGNDIGSYRFPCERYTDEIQGLVKKATGRDCSKK